jgi:hypothetical protein
MCTLQGKYPLKIPISENYNETETCGLRGLHFNRRETFQD